VEKGYIQTYNWVAGLLGNCDFDDAERRLGFGRSSDGALTIHFLGREYRIIKTGVELADTGDSALPEIFDFNVRSILGYYALSDGNCDPVMDFYPLSYFSHGIFISASHDGVLAADPIRKAIGGDYKKFCAAAERLGLVFEETRGEGKYVWSYRLLPKLPVKTVYYEGDDEFPSDVRILYDKTAPLFFKFEPLAVLNSCFIQALAAAALHQ
jgi:hypothetical protein